MPFFGMSFCYLKMRKAIKKPVMGQYDCFFYIINLFTERSSNEGKGEKNDDKKNNEPSGKHYHIRVSNRTWDYVCSEYCTFAELSGISEKSNGSV